MPLISVCSTSDGKSAAKGIINVSQTKIYPDLFHELLAKLEADWQGLPDKPEETPHSTLCTLWDFVTQAERPEAGNSQARQALTPEEAAQVKELVARRMAGEPLAYLVGRQHYMGLALMTSPDAMIPRKETELLGQTALQIAQRLAAERGKLQALDLCTGSGNVALALAHYINEYQGIGSDISENAVSLAQRNASALRVADRVQFVAGDLFEPFEREKYFHAFDLITCNPPYIATANAEKMADEIAQYEPREAFDGGPFGINVMIRLIREAPHFLKPASWLLFEVGLGQGEVMQRMMEKTAAYQHIGSRLDENGHIRVLLGLSGG
jgi:release factor glutamine methyltransferase